MTDFDQSDETTGASDTPPASAGTDIEAILTRALSAQAEETDKRFKGFQSLVDRKLDGLSRSMADQLKAAGLSPEQQEQLEEATTAKELEELRRYKAMQERRKEHPEAVDFFQEVMSLDSFEDQLAFIESRLGKAVAQEVEDAVEDAQSEAAEAVAPVNANRPARAAKPMGVAAALGSGEMSDEAADAILAAAGDQRGVLAKLRDIGR